MNNPVAVLFYSLKSVSTVCVYFYYIISLDPFTLLRSVSSHLFTPVFALLMCTSMTITKCDFPEPSVEFYQDSTGFKTSISGLSVALTGGWRTQFGIM